MKVFEIIATLKSFTKAFSIQKVKFFGKWLGIVAAKDKKISGASIIDRALIYECESNFHLIESALLSKVKEKVKTIEQLREKCKQTDAQLKAAQAELERFKRCRKNF